MMDFFFHCFEATDGQEKKGTAYRALEIHSSFCHLIDA